MHGRQEAAYEKVKDLASKDEKEKLYFIAKDAEEVQELRTRIDRTFLIMGAEEIKVIEEALDGRRFRL
jgi:hypothetical protein